jgi:hypothetical protein
MTNIEPQPQQTDWSGCAKLVVENGVFALGMLLMFSKTVDLLEKFAPSNIFGYTGIEVYYGIAVGCLVEGALFIMKLTLPSAKNPVEWIWNVVVIILPFLISGLAQVFDSFITRDTLSQQPAEIQFFVSWFVPSIPTIIVFLLIGKSIFSSIPTDIMPKGISASKPEYRTKTPVVGRFVFRLPKFLQRSRKSEPVNPTPATSEKKPAPR